jgi:hypothetical protein
LLILLALEEPEAALEEQVAQPQAETRPLQSQGFLSEHSVLLEMAVTLARPYLPEVEERHLAETPIHQVPLVSLDN